MPKRNPITVELIRIHRRINGFYKALNEEKWEQCFKFIDPELRAERVDHDAYLETLAEFFDKYCPIEIQGIEGLTALLQVKEIKFYKRPFAFGLVRWRDRQEQPHVFRERWVKTKGKWYTRMIGVM